MKNVLRNCLIFLSGIGFCLWCLICLSSNSLPGENLYPIKTCWEKAQLTIAVDPNYHQTLTIRYQLARKLELNTLIEQGRVAKVYFSGVVQDVKESEIVVDGILCEFDSQTVIIGKELMILGTVADMELRTRPFDEGGFPTAPLILSVKFHRRFDS